MEKFTTEQRTKIVEFYFQNQNPIIVTQRAYHRHFNVRNSRSESMIRRLIGRFQQQGSVRDLPWSERPRSVPTKKNIEHMQASIQEEPEKSTRRLPGQLGVSRTSLRRILRADLHVYPYKVQLVQELKPIDYRERLNFAVAKFTN